MGGSKDAAMIMARKIRPAGAADKPSNYHRYVEETIRDDLTFDECAALMAHYGCSFEELANRIVLDRMGKPQQRI